jgi:hypothetical protein
MFTVSGLGSKLFAAKMERLKQQGRLKEVAQEINTAHADAMRRRPIPVKTGALRRSLTVVGDAERIFREHRNGFEIGSRLNYARYQRRRIRELNATERREVFVKPVEQAFNNILRRG